MTSFWRVLLWILLWGWSKCTIYIYILMLYLCTIHPTVHSTADAVQLIFAMALKADWFLLIQTHQPRQPRFRILLSFSRLSRGSRGPWSWNPREWKMGIWGSNVNRPKLKLWKKGSTTKVLHLKRAKRSKRPFFMPASDIYMYIIHFTAH